MGEKLAMREGVIRNGIVEDEKLKEILPTIVFGFKYNEEKKRYESYMNGEYVEAAIRGLEVSDNVSLIASLPYVRELLVEKQREMAKEGGVIMDGRDIGSVVFPHAEVKFFIFSSGISASIQASMSPKYLPPQHHIFYFQIFVAFFHHLTHFLI